MIVDLFAGPGGWSEGLSAGGGSTGGRLAALRTNQIPPGDDDYYRRSVDHPAPVITSQAQSYRWLRSGNQPHSAVRHVDQPAPTMLFGHRANDVRWYPDKESARHPMWVHERPATTIVGSFRPDIVAAPGYRTDTSRQDQPDSVQITVQEAGILQSFPADYPWQGSKTRQFEQVGNAVPPLLAAHILAGIQGRPVDWRAAA